MELITKWKVKEDVAKLMTFSFSAGLQEFVMVGAAAELVSFRFLSSCDL